MRAGRQLRGSGDLFQHPVQSLRTVGADDVAIGLHLGPLAVDVCEM